MVRADSLMRTIKTAAQGRAVAKRLGYTTNEYQFGVDEFNRAPDMQGYFDRLFKLKPGEVMPVKWLAKGAGYWITWVDTIAPAIDPTWEDARDKALAASGWSLDSLGALWGGLARSKDLSAVGTTQRASLPVALDSLVFGLNGR